MHVAADGKSSRSVLRNTEEEAEQTSILLTPLFQKQPPVWVE